MVLRLNSIVLMLWITFRVSITGALGTITSNTNAIFFWITNSTNKRDQHLSMVLTL